MIFYYLTFILLLTFYVIGELNNNHRKYLLFICAIILFTIAGFRGRGVDGDYGGYVGMYNDAETLSYYIDNFDILIAKDPMVTIISSAAKYLFDDGLIFLFLVFAFLGVLFKIKAIKELSPFWLLSILVYYSQFFLLHEMTQIRAGVASGLLLLSIPSIREKHFLNFLKYVFLASLFHYSALVFLPLYFINHNKINVSLYVIILVGSIMLFVLNVSIHPLFNLFGENPITQRYFIYVNAYSLGKNTEHNPFNVLILLHIVVSMFLLWKAKDMALKNKYSIILIKIYIFSTAVFYLFSDMPVFAVRFYEMLTIVEIILIPCIINTFKQKNLASYGVVLYAFGLLSLQLLHSNLLQPYF